MSNNGYSNTPRTELEGTDAGKIERELRSIWEQSTNQDGSHPSLLRTCTLNLIVCVRDATEAERLTNMLQLLVRYYPNRTILIMTPPPVSPTDTIPLQAWVQANCQLITPGQPQVCGEQITVDAHGTTSATAASLLISLLMPDVPVAVWWYGGGSPFAHPIFDRLHNVTNRLILDTAGFAEQPTLLRVLAERIKTSATAPLHMEVSDLTWTCLNPWRELTAQFFDNPSLQEHLHRLDRVRITYDPQQPAAGRMQALLLFAWLSVCLGWSPLGTISQEGDVWRIYARRAAPAAGPKAVRILEVEIAVEEEPMPLDLPAEAPIRGILLQSLQLSAIDNVLATFTIRRTDTARYLHTSAEIAGAPALTRLARVQQLTPEEVLAADLRDADPDLLYPVLDMCAQLVG